MANEISMSMLNNIVKLLDFKFEPQIIYNMNRSVNSFYWILSQFTSSRKHLL